MSEKRDKKESSNLKTFGQQIGDKADRKIKAQGKTSHSIWYGFGMFGLVGWSVAVPTLLGALGGMWIDKHFPGKHSWTLMLLVSGLIIGCLIAWHWIDKESKEDDKDE